MKKFLYGAAIGGSAAVIVIFLIHFVIHVIGH